MAIRGKIEFTCDQCRASKSSFDSVQYLSVEVRVESAEDEMDSECSKAHDAQLCSVDCVKQWIDGLGVEVTPQTP